MKDSASPPDEDDREVELPFSVELGNPKSSARGFAVGGIENRGSASFAFVALLPTSSGEARNVELGRVYGDVEPPAVAPFGNEWLVAIADNDAGSVVLRLAALAPPYAPGNVQRGVEISAVRRDASGFALESDAQGGLVAFSRLDKVHGRIAVAAIDPKGPRLRGEIAILQPSPEALNSDAEAPRLVRRPSGYYLAYIAREPALRPKSGTKLDPDSGVSEGLLEEGPSAIEIVALDTGGKPVTPPKRVTPTAAHVIAFDLAVTPDGSALVTYRDDKDGPGLDRHNLQAILVHPDGSSATRAWEVGESPGLPSILVDSVGAPNRAWAFVSVSHERETRLAPLGSDPLSLPEPVAVPGLEASELLAVSGGRFLCSRTRGRERELSVVLCDARH